MVLKIDARIFKIDARIFDIDARIRIRFWRLVHLAAELRTPRKHPWFASVLDVDDATILDNVIRKWQSI